MRCDSCSSGIRIKRDSILVAWGRMVQTRGEQKCFTLCRVLQLKGEQSHADVFTTRSKIRIQVVRPSEVRPPSMRSFIVNFVGAATDSFKNGNERARDAEFNERAEANERFH